MALGMGRLACACSCINDDDDNVDADVDDVDDDDDDVVAAAGREIVELLSDTDPAVRDVIALLPTDDLGHINCQPSFQLNVDVDVTVLLLSLDNFLLRYTST